MFALILMLLWLGPSDQQVVCSPTILSTDSYVVTGHVVFTDGTKDRTGVEVEVFWLQGDEWKLASRIRTLARGDFAYPSDRRGQYKFVANKPGFKSNEFIVRIKNQKDSHGEIVLPLSKTLCPKARYSYRRGVS